MNNCKSKIGPVSRKPTRVVRKWAKISDTPNATGKRNNKIKKGLTPLASCDKIDGRMEVGLFFMPKIR